VSEAADPSVQALPQALREPGQRPGLIPRIFHQVWINDSSPELPDEYRRYRDRWLELHPGWEYRLWNRDNLDFVQRRADLMSQCAHYAQMADVLRLEVLFQHGGVYLDTDFEPLRPIDAIVGGDAGHVFCSEDGAHISTGLIGARPRSPLIARLLDALPKRLGGQPVNVETGPSFVTRQLLAEGFDADVRVAPSRWFYPYGWDEPHRAGESFPEAFAVHRWAHSWGKPPTLRSRVGRGLRRILRARS